MERDEDLAMVLLLSSILVARNLSRNKQFSSIYYRGGRGSAVRGKQSMIQVWTGI